MPAKYHTVYPKTRTTRELRKRVPLPTGFTTVQDGTEELFYVTSINFEALHEMARSAAGNKSGICNDGPLRVEIVKRSKI
jgi:hypothetical protein